MEIVLDNLHLQILNPPIWIFYIHCYISVQSMMFLYLVYELNIKQNTCYKDFLICSWIHWQLTQICQFLSFFWNLDPWNVFLYKEKIFYHFTSTREIKLNTWWVECFYQILVESVWIEYLIFIWMLQIGLCSIIP